MPELPINGPRFLGEQEVGFVTSRLLQGRARLSALATTCNRGLGRAGMEPFPAGLRVMAHGLVVYSRFFLTRRRLLVETLNLSDQDSLPAIRLKIPANARST